MSTISTHVLDTGSGKPAEGVAISLERQKDGNWQMVASGVTNADGRIPDFMPKGETIENGFFRMIFQVGDYFSGLSIDAFYSEIPVPFHVREDSHYHVPLLISPFGYSTYRGS